jgi:hypothetical protein
MQGRGHSPLRKRGARQRRNAGGHENEQARNMREGFSSKPSLSLPDNKFISEGEKQHETDKRELQNDGCDQLCRFLPVHAAGNG